MFRLENPVLPFVVKHVNPMPTNRYRRTYFTRLSFAVSTLRGYKIKRMCSVDREFFYSETFRLKNYKFKDNKDGKFILPDFGSRMYLRETC